MAISTTALLIASTIVTAVGAISQGNAARRQADFNAAAILQQSERQAQIDEQQAQIKEQQSAREREVAGVEEDDFRREQRRLFAQRRAALGVSGIDISTGSPLLAAEDFITEAEFQALRIRSGGETSAIRLKQEADLIRQQSERNRRAGINSATLTSAAGKSAQTRGFTRAGASLLTGFGTDFGKNFGTTIHGTQSTI